MPTQATEEIANLPMPSGLVAQMEEVARAEGKQLLEVTQDAIEQFLEDRRWQNLVRYGKDRARNLGLKRTDVPRLIAESRREPKP